MTVILDDPMETTTNWTGGTLSTVTGHSGNALRLQGTLISTYSIPAGPLRTSSASVKFWWKIESLAAERSFAQYRNGGTGTLTLQVTTTGALQVRLGTTTGTINFTSATGLIAINTWNLIEWSIVCADAPDGIYTLKLNGTQLVRRTGVDTRTSATDALIDSFVFPGPGAGIGSIYDEFLLQTGDVLAANAKVYNGSAFVDAPVKVWNGTAFVDAVAVKTWSGSAFVP